MATTTPTMIRANERPNLRQIATDLRTAHQDVIDSFLSPAYAWIYEELNPDSSPRAYRRAVRRVLLRELALREAEQAHADAQFFGGR